MWKSLILSQLSISVKRVLLIFLTTLTVNGQKNIVNHKNTHSTEGTPHLGRKSSKFDT